MWLGCSPKLVGTSATSRTPSRHSTSGAGSPRDFEPESRPTAPAERRRTTNDFGRTSRARWPFLTSSTAYRLARAYGTRIEYVLGNAHEMAKLGEHFGAGLTEAEVSYLRTREWARSAEDILWRRTKLGLHLSNPEAARLTQYLSR